ncbi:hypothetical protein C1646_23012 [Rhizophagus diaphanus]|nr:hypothetical protein C1646_23012 [Rhizophagus diaphanus] [Rhizophagus sp. MUCL 43196]
MTVHEYFNRKHTDWSVIEFLNESKEEPFQLKIGLYIKSLEEIDDHEQGKKKERARILLDRYKKASKQFFFTGNADIVTGVIGIFTFPCHSSLYVEPENQHWGTGDLYVCLMFKSLRRPMLVPLGHRQSLRLPDVQVFTSTQWDEDLVGKIEKTLVK